MKYAVTTASFIPREMHGLVHVVDAEDAPRNGHIYVRCYGDTLGIGWDEAPPGSTPTCMECVIAELPGSWTYVGNDLTTRMRSARVRGSKGWQYDTETKDLAP